MGGNTWNPFVEPDPEAPGSLDHMRVRDDEAVSGDQNSRSGTSFLRNDTAPIALRISFDRICRVKYLDHCRFNLPGNRLQ
jgi:hypothetical protein